MSVQKLLFSALFEQAGIGMLLADQSGHTLKTNRMLQEWLGYSANELQSMTFDQFTSPEDVAGDHDLFRELVQGKRTRYQVETRCIRKNGDVVWGRATVSLVHSPASDRILVFRIIEDIQQRKQIEQALKVTAARNRAIFEQAAIGIMVVDIEGKLLESNAALQAMLEYTGDELSQVTFYDLTHPDDLADDHEQFDDLVQNHRAHYQIEKRLRCKDDSFIWVKTTVSVVQSASEHSQFAVRMVENITARKQAEEAFRKAYRAYRMLSQANQILVRADDQNQLLQDVCRVIVEEDKYVMAWVGFARQDEQKSIYPAAYAGHEARYLFADTWADVEHGSNPVGTAIRTGQPSVAQHIMTNPDFEPWRAEALEHGYASFIALPLLAGHKTFGALNIYAPEPDAFIPDEIVLLEELANDLAFGIIALRTRDLHEQAGRDLQASETRYAHIVETTPDAIISVESTGQIISWNPAAETMFGYSADEVVGKSVTVIIPERFRQTHQVGMRRFLSTREPTIIGTTVEMVGLRRDGSEFPLELALAYWEADGETFFTSIMRDVTARKQAEEQRREREESFRLLFENNPHPMWVYDLETLAFLEVNDAAMDHYGYSRAEFLSMRLTDIRPPEDTARLLEDIQRERPALQHSGMWRHTLKNGQIIDVAIVSHTLEFAGHKAALVVAQDITERLRAEEMLRLQSAALRSAANAIVITDTDGTIIWVNPAFTAMTGYAAHESLGRNPRELVRSGLHDQAVYKMLWDTIRAGHVWHGELTNRRKDGSLYTEEQTITPVLERDGSITHFVAVKQNITDRKRAEDALHASEEKYRQIVETAQEGIWIIDADNRTTFVNDRMAEMLGYTADEMLGQSLFTFIDDEAATQATANVERRRQGVREQHEFVFRCKDGSPLWTLVSTNPLFDQDGHYRGAQALVTDISDLKRIQQAEHEQRMLAEAIADTANALISALDLDTVMNTILEGVARVVPHDAVNIMLIEGDLARPVYWRGYRPDHIPYLQDFRISVTTTPNLRQMIETGSSFLASYIDQYPDWISQPLTEWVKSYVAVPIRSQGSVIGILNLDSGTPGFFNEQHTQRLQVFADQASIAIEHAQLYEEIRRHAAELEQRVEERTAQLNQTLRHIETILNSSDDIIILCSPDSTIIQMNPAFGKTFKCQPDEALSHPLAKLAAPNHVPLLDQAFRGAIGTGQPQRLEITARCKEHTRFDADVVLSPIIEQDDQISGVVCSLRNITARKKMEAQLRHMLEHEIELNELKSRYISMAAHDLRNPLAVIQSSIDLVHRYGNRLTDKQKQEKFDRIRINIALMVEMLDDILTLGKAESGKLSFEPAPLDLIAFCENIVAEVQPITATSWVINFDSQGECSTVVMDGKLLRHILGNLLSNGIKYSPAEKPVTFTVRCEPDQIIFRVQDEGIGIPEADQKQLFETFYRASNARHIPGTGLGMAIVKQSVELHGGTITFESTEGVGTTFTVVLPTAPSGA